MWCDRVLLSQSEIGGFGVEKGRLGWEKFLKGFFQTPQLKRKLPRWASPRPSVVLIRGSRLAKAAQERADKVLLTTF